MRKSLFNYVVDLVSFLLMLGMVATGLVMRYILPSGTGGRGGGNALTLSGGTRHDWGSVHFWASTALLALLLLHLILHWSWVCAITRRLTRGPDAPAGATKPVNRMLYGLATAAVVVMGFGTFLWVAPGSAVRTGHRRAQVADQRDTGQLMSVSEHQEMSTSRPTHVNSEGYEDEADPQDIRGSMTLEEVASAANISSALLRDSLGLPVSAPLDERLGRLRRQYAFEMSEIRSAVHELKTNSLASGMPMPGPAK